MIEIAKIVNETITYCLFAADELENGIPADAIIVEGITMKLGFHAGRVEEKKPIIKELLNEMPSQFHESGWTFLNLCQDKNGNQWADLHRTMEALVVLGIAVGMASFCFQRDLWKSLPGGVPYVRFNTNGL
jgi:hypothetical protein